MSKAKRVLVLIAIVLCVMQILAQTVQIISPGRKASETPWSRMLEPRQTVVLRKTLVWYAGGLLVLAAAINMAQTQAVLQFSFGVAGVCALLVGSAGGGFSGRTLLGPRFALSLLTLAILVGLCLRLSRPASTEPSSPPPE